MPAQTDYLAENQRYYEEQYACGYGHLYPESHVIKIYHRILARDLNLTGAGAEKLLDFGCGTGANAVFFASKGFDVYGVDISALAIEKCRRALPDITNHFQVIAAKPSANDVFGGEKFDVIFSNQVLYFLSDGDRSIRLHALTKHLKSGGILIATMIGTAHYLYRHSSPAENGLRKVLTGPDPDHPVYMRFTESQDHLRKQFECLEPIAIGYYDINLCEDSGFHYVFIGRLADS